MYQASRDAAMFEKENLEKNVRCDGPGLEEEKEGQYADAEGIEGCTGPGKVKIE
jgi:hypothetical protein